MANSKWGILAVVLWLVGNLAWGAAARTITVALLVNPPYTMAEADTDGQPQGFIPDLFRAITIPGVQWQMKILPWARMLDQTQNDKTGTIVLPTLTRTPDRESLFTWIVQIDSPRYYFLQKAPAKTAPDPSSLKDKVVTVLLGNWEDIWLRDNGFQNLKEVASLDHMVRLVDAGRADLMLKDMTSLSYFLKSLGLPKGYFNVLTEVKELHQPLYIAGSLPMDPELAAAIRDRVEALQKSGDLDRIWRRWR